MRRKWILLCMIALLVLSCSVPVFAQDFDGDRTGSITVTLIEQDEKQPIPGAEFDVYRVASVGRSSDGKLTYSYVEDFRNCQIPLEDPELAGKLSAFVAENPVPAERIVTDADGVAACGDLELGLYLVKQVGQVEGFTACTPFLVTVPIQDETGFVYDVNATPKTDIVRLVSVTVRAQWNTDDPSQIPESVTVELLCDGVMVKSARLSRSNNWQVTYDNMPASDAYSILEAPVPQGFIATYARQGYVFTAINTAALAQTGQLVWPISVLSMAGLVFLLVGFVILRKPRKTDA